MKNIALLTDFGDKDNFVGVMKGVILGINPRVNIVDITHSIKPQDVFEAAFLLKGSFRFFPKGCIFLVVVDPGVGSERRPLIIRTKKYVFVGPDNGVLSLAAYEDGIKEIVMIENRRYFLKDISSTFHGRDIFAPVSAWLSIGKRCSLFGRHLDSIERLKLPEAKAGNKALRGEVIYIDRFGNLVTNIARSLFSCFTQNESFKIKIRSAEINLIANSYQTVGKNKPLAIFGSFGYLEISVNGGSAKEYFGAKKGTTLEIIRR